MKKLCLLFILAFGFSIIAQTTEENNYKTEDVTFKNGEISLAGRLYLPNVKSPPAVIFTHGSGAVEGRNNQRFILETEYLVKKGIAVLLYDKRGSGNSTSDWKKANFHDLAEDAIAAFRFLKNRTEINTKKIGFRGASQAGYVLPIVVTKLKKEAAFMILISPAIVSPTEQILYQIETALRANRSSEDDIKEALAYTRAGFEFARTGNNWEVYENLSKQNKDKAWFKSAQGPSSKDDWFFAWLKSVADFDVVPLMKKSVCPTLVYFGEEDTISPVKIAKPIVEKIFTKGASTNKIISYPIAGHDLRYLNEQGQRIFPADFLVSLSSWILKK